MKVISVVNSATKANTHREKSVNMCCFYLYRSKVHTVKNG